MPLLNLIKERFAKEKPFKELSIGVCLHLEKKTGVLLETLKVGGAKLAAASCNPLTTDDRVATALAKSGIEVYAWAGENEKEYYENINRVLNHKPDLVIDDGCDQIFMIHKRRRELLGKIKGGCEETTTGINRLKVMEREGALKFPVISVNEAYSKFLFDNRFGTAQSTIDAIMRITNKLIAGKTIVVVGYGWCGRGISDRIKGLGANVVVVEVGGRLPNHEGSSGYHRALEALYEGNRVMSMDEAAEIGDIFITATGNTNVINAEHFKKMKNGAILANAGHFTTEIDVKGLGKISVKKEFVKDNIERYILKNGKKLYLLSEGRLVNLARPSGQGHPIEIMDGSFAIQALCLEHLAKNEKMGPGIYKVPREIDDKVAELALSINGVKLKKPTREQIEYASSWESGT
jgi:adenosylhomocysteinase